MKKSGCGVVPFIDEVKNLLFVVGGYGPTQSSQRVVSGSSTPSSTIFALQLLIASHKQFRGVLGGRALQF